MAGSAISAVTKDSVHVRGKDLVGELIGRRDFVDMFLLQLSGREPTAMQKSLVEAVMVAIMEHGLVPSVVAARLTLLGAPESLQGAVAAGLLGVGDHFAGTASACAELLAQIVALPKGERTAAAAGIVADHAARKRPVPGFGHPNHKGGDPRYHRLIEVARDAGAAGDHIEAGELLQDALAARAGKTIVPNISLAIGVLLLEAGLPITSLRGVVLIARCAGLVGHLAEEMVNPSANLMWRATEAAMADAAGA